MEMLILNVIKNFNMYYVVFFKCPNFIFPNLKSLIFNITSFSLGPNIHRMFTFEGEYFHMLLFMFKYVIQVSITN